MFFSTLGKIVATTATVSALAVTPAFANTTTVQPGQTMWKIARANNVSLSSLEAANPSVNPWNLLVGTHLQLPSQPAHFAAVTNSTSASNLYWMEHIINAEAGGESLQAQIAVGDTVLHRLETGTYGSTVHDVVFAISNGHYQFTTVANGYVYSNPNASSVTAAEDVLWNNVDVVPGAQVFYNPAKTPAGSWVWSQPTIRKIGNLVFAK